MSSQHSYVKKHHKKKRKNDGEQEQSVRNMKEIERIGNSDNDGKTFTQVNGKKNHAPKKRKKLSEVSAFIDVNDGPVLADASPTKKMCLAVKEKTVKKYCKNAAKQNFVFGNIAKNPIQDKKDARKENPTIKQINNSVSSPESKDPPMLTASAIRKKCLPSKPEDMSQNWKTYLQARTERWKHSRKPFLKRPREPVEKESPEVWFDDVDEILLDRPEDTEVSHLPNDVNGLVKPNSFAGLTKVVAMDCEMVGVGSSGRESILARVSIVNQFGQCLYDKYVAPTEKVTDYRTSVSGIRAKDIAEGIPFKTVQKEVSDILKDRILAGHAVHNDLKVLFLDHPRNYTRDTSNYKPFRKVIGGGIPSLKRLSEKLLQVRVQEGEHNSVQDAQAAMRLYTMHRKEWEKSLAFKRKKPSKRKKKKKPSV